MFGDNIKITNTKDENKYIKDNLKLNIKEDDYGRLYAELKLPMIRHNKKTMDIVDIEFYLDQLDLRPVGDSLDVCYGLGGPLFTIDNRPREVTFKVKQNKDGSYFKATTHSIMTMEEIEKRLGHKVILKED